MQAQKVNTRKFNFTISNRIVQLLQLLHLSADANKLGQIVNGLVFAHSRVHVEANAIAIAPYQLHALLIRLRQHLGFLRKWKKKSIKFKLKRFGWRKQSCNVEGMQQLSSEERTNTKAFLCLCGCFSLYKKMITYTKK